MSARRPCSARRRAAFFCAASALWLGPAARAEPARTPPVYQAAEEAHRGARAARIKAEAARDCINRAVLERFKAQVEIEELKAEKHKKEAERDSVIRDLRGKDFCSLCKNTRTEIRKRGESFEDHIRRVKARILTAAEKDTLVAEKRRGFDRDIASLDRRIARRETARLKADGKREKCRADLGWWRWVSDQSAVFEKALRNASRAPRLREAEKREASRKAVAERFKKLQGNWDSRRTELEPPTQLRPSDRYLAALKQREGFGDKSRGGCNLQTPTKGSCGLLYEDVAGHCTVGFGHKLHDGPCRPNDQDWLLKSYGARMNPQEGEKLLKADLAKVKHDIEAAINVKLTQGMFDALTDLFFNVGHRKLAGRSILRRLNAGEYDLAAAEFLMWDNVTENGARVSKPGLTKRAWERIADFYGSAP